MDDKTIQIGDFVEVTESTYTLAAPPGTRGTVTRTETLDGEPLFSIDREDGTGIGWAEKVRKANPKAAPQ